MAKITNPMLIPDEVVLNKIYFIRGHKVMLDEDLAELYQVETKRLNEQVKRNMLRFPKDFMFQLTGQEFENLKSQIATSSWGGRRKLPFAFTEQGVAMLSTVLRSNRAVQASVAIMRAFVQLRQILGSHAELARKLAQLERRIEGHDTAIRSLFDAIRQLMNPPQPEKKGRIGFQAIK